jgi:hypothetical protein
VGAMASPPAMAREALAGHDAVARDVAAHAPAVLPARFGTLLDGEAQLREMLAGREPELLAALALVRGREQMTLRLYGTLDAAPPEPAGDGPGARYLAARAATIGTPRRHPQIAALLDRVAPLVRAERLEAHQTPPLVASAYHLIDRGGASAYRAALRPPPGASAALRVSISGPWPPYAFTEPA